MFDFVSAGFCRGNSVGNDQRRVALACEGCSVKFTVFKRRRQCSICQRHYCTHCLPLGGQNGGSNSTASVLARFSEKKLKCSKCKVLTARPLCRTQLRQLRVKDLQLYLTSQQVSTRGCVEKDDLVNLLIRHAGGATSNSQRNEPFFGQSSETGFQSGDRTFSQNLQETTHIPCQNLPSTSDTPHNIRTTGAETSERASESKGNETSSDQEATIPAEPSSPDTTCHISTSSSSSSSNSNPDWFAQPSLSSGVHIVEVMDWMGENSNSDSEPQPLVTVVEEESSQRRGSVTSSVSLSDLPEDVTSVPSHMQAEENAEEDTPMEVEEIPGEISSVSENVTETSEELLETIVEETADEEPIITTQACTGITLSSIDNLEDLEKLTVKQLKELLSLNRVDYRGCCEKPELVERVARLWQDDNQARKALDSMTMDELCKICMDAPVECVMLECGHMATCTACGKQLSECPICRQFVVRVVRTFRA